MAQPTATEAKLVDKSDNPQIADRQTAISAAPTISAYSAHASGGTTVTSNAATDLDTTAAALATLRGEVATLATRLDSILSLLEAHGLMADN